MTNESFEEDEQVINHAFHNVTETEIWHLANLLDHAGFERTEKLGGATYLAHPKTGVTIHALPRGIRIAYPAGHAPMHSALLDLDRNVTYRVVADLACALSSAMKPAATR